MLLTKNKSTYPIRSMHLSIASRILSSLQPCRTLFWLLLMLANVLWPGSLHDKLSPLTILGGLLIVAIVYFIMMREE